MGTLPHIMVDVETLGLGDHAPIIQIGAVRFDYHTHDEAPDGWVSSPYGEFRRNILARDWTNIDADTMQWWMKQDGQVRRKVFDQHDAVPLAVALDEFRLWVDRGGPVEGVWADSPNFDLRLLRQAWERVGMCKPWPFSHRVERCFRTLKREFRTAADEVEFVGRQHDALDDAHHQALVACRILRRLKNS